MTSEDLETTWRVARSSQHATTSRADGAELSAAVVASLSFITVSSEGIFRGVLAGMSHRASSGHCRWPAALAVFFVVGSGPGCTFWDMDTWDEQAVDGGTGPAEVIARDAFDREVDSGLGTADVGGAWSVHGNDTTFAVADGVAKLSLDVAGAGPFVALDAVSTDDADVQVTVTADKLGSGSGLYTSVVARTIDSNLSYYTTLALHDDGTIDAILIRKQTTEEKIVRSTALLTVTPGEAVRVRVQAEGTAPTHLRMKAWKAVDTEPAEWSLEVEDDTPELQTPGAVALSSYLSLSAMNAPLLVSFDDFIARHASLAP